MWHEASDAGKRQLGNTFIRFVCWKVVILETSTKTTIPNDIMMTVVTGAVSILENMHAEGMRKGPHSVSIWGLNVLAGIGESKKLNIVVKNVSKSLSMINVALKWCFPNVSYLEKGTNAETVCCWASLVLKFPGTHFLTPWQSPGATHPDQNTLTRVLGVTDHLCAVWMHIHMSWSFKQLTVRLQHTPICPRGAR